MNELHWGFYILVVSTKIVRLDYCVLPRLLTPPSWQYKKILTLTAVNCRIRILSWRPTGWQVLVALRKIFWKLWKQSFINPQVQFIHCQQQHTKNAFHWGKELWLRPQIQLLCNTEDRYQKTCLLTPTLSSFPRLQRLSGSYPITINRSPHEEIKISFPFLNTLPRWKLGVSTKYIIQHMQPRQIHEVIPMSTLSREDTTDLQAWPPTLMQPTSTDEVETKNIENLRLLERGLPTTVAVKTTTAANNPACRVAENVTYENAFAWHGRIPYIRFWPFLDTKRVERPTTTTSRFGKLEFLT